MQNYEFVSGIEHWMQSLIRVGMNNNEFTLCIGYGIEQVRTQ
jgi:hypothetical protein